MSVLLNAGMASSMKPAPVRTAMSLFRNALLFSRSTENRTIARMSYSLKLTEYDSHPPTLRLSARYPSAGRYNPESLMDAFSRRRDGKVGRLSGWLDFKLIHYLIFCLISDIKGDRARITLDVHFVICSGAFLADC